MEHKYLKNILAIMVFFISIKSFGGRNAFCEKFQEYPGCSGHAETTGAESIGIFHEEVDVEKIKGFCADKGETIKIEEIKEMIGSHPNTGSCIVLDSLHYASPKEGNFGTFDGYSGPVMVLKMFRNEPTQEYKTSSIAGTLAIRENVAKKCTDGENRTYIAYDLTASGEAGTLIESVVLQFEKGHLKGASQASIVTVSEDEGTNFRIFHCGELSPPLTN